MVGGFRNKGKPVLCNLYPFSSLSLFPKCHLVFLVWFNPVVACIYLFIPVKQVFLVWKMMTTYEIMNDVKKVDRENIFSLFRNFELRVTNEISQ